MILTGILPCWVAFLESIFWRIFKHFIGVFLILSETATTKRSQRDYWTDCNWTRTHNHLFHKQTINHLAKLAIRLSCVVSTVHLTVCIWIYDYLTVWCIWLYRVWIHSEMCTWHGKYIQSKYILTTQLNRLASLAKWLSVRLWTKWLWVRVQLQSLKLQILRLLLARSSLTFRQL